MYRVPSYLATFFTTFISVMTIDLLVIYAITQPIFGPSLAHLLAPSVHIMGALIAWALLVIGIMFFVVPKNRMPSYPHTLLYGALWGFIIYGIYESTNYALINSWPLPFFLFDWAWGILLSSITSLIVRYLQDES